MRPPRGTLPAWMNEHYLDDPNGPCVLWPFGANPRTGYGAMRVDGKMRTVHSYACFLREGPPQPGQVARHSCRNRLCIVHVRWGTYQQNESDKVDDGTHNRGERHGMAKLTDEQVRSILNRLAAGERRAALMEEFDVCEAVIRHIATGKSWKHIERI